MIVALLLESWDSYSMAFILPYINTDLNPSAMMLGFAAAGVHIGGLIGALLGGWATDRFGRRRIFLASMIMFIVCALAQGLAPNMLTLAIIRTIGGIPIGCDVANGFTYMMEVLPKGKRETMANRWQCMYAIGTMLSVILVTILQFINLEANLLWRFVLMFPAIPGIILLLMRTELPETPAWLLDRGKFREAKAASRVLYGDLLDDLPDTNVPMRSPTIGEAFRDVWGDRRRRNVTIVGMVSNATQPAEWYAFGFYIPLILVSFGFTTQLENNLFLIGLSGLAALSGFVGPVILHRIGHKGLLQAGNFLTASGLFVASYGIYQAQTLIVALGAAIVVWGHYWGAQSGQTIVTVVAKPKYRGVSSGFAYAVTKTSAFLLTMAAPAMFTLLGVPKAAMLTAIFPLITLFLATFVLKEVYGHTEQELPVRADNQSSSPSAGLDVGGRAVAAGE
ncbi:MFS transporter [Novosphingobium flavum]|uniref:MFS transporter n=2 Tax=Novosphingobium flavum TaxID=1778672 RepID=A0A7X1FTM2_9SPHN|nr:MFS transporter [Novosphingobium flavum]MBC2666726.1 MFS transporter [Novosphingobium flavum]